VIPNQISAAENYNQTYLQIVKNNPNIDKKLAQKIASHIDTYSKKYGIPAKVYTAIIMQESSYNIKATNKRCGYSNEYNKVACVVVDVGLSQINYKTVAKYNLDRRKLASDVEYSVKSGAQVLSWFHQKYANKEPKTWFCRYNVGTGSHTKIHENCHKYIKNVNRYL
jgi:soluble lytic murein transglycosylase-like protein